MERLQAGRFSKCWVKMFSSPENTLCLTLALNCSVAPLLDHCVPQWPGSNWRGEHVSKSGEELIKKWWRFIAKCWFMRALEILKKKKGKEISACLGLQQVETREETVKGCHTSSGDESVLELTVVMVTHIWMYTLNEWIIWYVSYILIKGEKEKQQNMNYGPVWTEELRLIFIFFFIFWNFPISSFIFSVYHEKIFIELKRKWCILQDKFYF